MFVRNKYRSWYLKIINNARKIDRKKGDGEYYEAHHILPRSIYTEYDKCDWNLVLLTAREHFVVHRLLTKCTKGSSRDKMVAALWIMANDKARINMVTSRDYEMLRKEFIENKSKVYTFYRPDGRKITVKNLADYCRRHSLSLMNMHSMLSGRTTHAHGYTLTKDARKKYVFYTPEGELVETFSITEYFDSVGREVPTNFSMMITGKCNSAEGYSLDGLGSGSRIERVYTFYSPEGEKNVVSSMIKFCEDNGLHPGEMSRVLSGKRRTHKGYRLNKELETRKRKNQDQIRVFIDPDGNRIEVKGLAEFCKNNNLSISHMTGVANGKRRIHRGYTSMEHKVVNKREKMYKFLGPNDEELTVTNLTAFSRENGLSSQSMMRMVNGRQTQHKGYRLVV